MCVDVMEEGCKEVECMYSMERVIPFRQEEYEEEEVMQWETAVSVGRFALVNNKLNNNNGTISPRRRDDHQSRDSPALSVQLERLLSCGP